MSDEDPQPSFDTGPARDEAGTGGTADAPAPADPADTATGAAPAPATARPDSYEVAAQRLEEIIKRLDSGTAGLRETLDLVREGRALVDYCATELEAVGKGLEELRLDDLIARLESNGDRA